MTASRLERILILCKTYPSPSSKYAETSCVAGMTESGKMIRLYPVPFRLIRDDKQFKKWQWVKARIRKAPKDHRPESHTVYVDTIETDGDPVPTKSDWRFRRAELEKLPLFTDFAEMEASRQKLGGTLALLRPDRIVALDITKADDPDWTAEELQKLVQQQRQGGLFDTADDRDVRLLRKLPYNFHYRYECKAEDEVRTYRHKLSDWEVGALYWNCADRYGANWEIPFRKKLEKDLPARDMHLLMGTIHRFPDKWLIISLIYPPNLKVDPQMQTEMIF